MSSKRSLQEEEEETRKKARVEAEGGNSVTVYQPNVVIPQLSKKMNALIEVLLPAKYLGVETKQVKMQQLWGTDLYTDDSDLVAVLVHTGHIKIKGQAKHTLLVSLRICPNQPTFTGSERNGITSREWRGAHPGVSFKVERCLQHASAELPPPELSMLRPGAATRQIPGSLCPLPPGPGQSFGVQPSACVVVFNLANDPCLKYSLALVADQSTEPERWTSNRLRRETLYLESRHRRFEIAQSGTQDGYDQYTMSEVLRPQLMDRKAMEASGVPLPAELVRRMHEMVDWEEFVWGPCFLRVRGNEYPLVRALYMPHTVAS
mmetsp:Transcript_47635/g.117950  ORF Transcript_47635/g.117950 Transcript_47635/m.117950 type:complete len:319 (+) Transcript_47635:41-997(+)